MQFPEYIGTQVLALYVYLGRANVFKFSMCNEGWCELGCVW